MSKLIVGSYLSKEEAVKAINIYELTGHEAKNIVALTNEEIRESLKKLTDVAVKSNTPKEREKETFTRKIKKIFMDNADLELDTIDKLVEYGLPKDDAIRCMADVNSGQIVVLADDELRMGQAPPINVEHH